MSRTPRAFVNGQLYCPRCDGWKDFNDFPDSRSSSYGKYSWCKTCKSGYFRKRDKRSKNTPGVVLHGKKLKQAASLSLTRWNKIISGERILIEK